MLEQLITVPILRYDSGERLRFRRTHVEQLAAKRSEWETYAIEQAIAKLDYHDAFARILARMLNAIPISAELMTAVFPWCRIPDAVGLVSFADGERGLRLLELSEHGRFAHDFDGASLRGLALHAAWILEGEKLRPRIVKELYRVRERFPAARGYYHSAIAGELARVLGEASLAHDYDNVIPEAVSNLRTALSANRQTILRFMLAELESADTPPSSHGMRKATVHAAPKVGRNEPCPCGSGQKYKRCHGSTGHEAPLTPSTVTVDDINGMLFDHLCMLDPKVLTDAPLSALLDRFLSAKAPARAEQVLEVLATRAGVSDEHISKRRSLMIFDAASCFRQDFVQRHIGKLSSVDRAGLEPYIRLGLALRTRSPDLGELLLEAASYAAKDDTGIRAQVLAAHMLFHAPAVGILLARGCMLSGAEETRSLLILAQDARAQLGLPPAEDLAVKIHAGLQHEQKARDARKEAENLRTALQDAARRIRELEQRGLDLEAQLRERIAAAACAERDVNTSEPADVRALREKIETLQARIREGNEERVVLRRELAAAVGGDRSDRSPSEAEPGDEGDAVSEDLRPRRVVVPAWSRAGEDGLRAVLSHVAVEALRTVADLAAGDIGAWRTVKRPKGADRSILLCRIGLHHRLLFSVDGDRLQVLEMVPRNGLDIAIKRLRATV